MSLSYRYERTEVGDVPITLKSAKSYLKVDGDVDNESLQNMISTVIQFGERYTGRDFRENIWTLYLDSFVPRICLRKSTVNAITSIEYLVSASLVTIATTVYYLKPGGNFSEILLSDGQAWPDDIDTIEAGIKIIFTTKIPRNIESYKIAALKHLAFLYQNRGDCEVGVAAHKSGATEKYDQGRIQRI